MPKPLVLFTVSWYKERDVRFECCMRMLKAAQERGLPCVVVDASADESIREEMARAGAVRSLAWK